MIDSNIINKAMLKKLFENSDKILLCIDNETKILDFNESFKPYAKSITHLKTLITYTHLNEFLENIKKLSIDNPVIKFTSNFSFDKYNIEDIPSSYEIILSLDNEKIYLLADPKPPLSHDDAKEYLTLVNDYSKTSRDLIKTKLKLQELNSNLKQEITKGVNELRKKDEILLKQSRDAAMGEMIDCIAHQWKNPLGTIGLIGQSIQMEYDLFKKLDSKKVTKSAKKLIDLTDHMLETLEEFRAFFRPNIPFEKISIKKLLDSIGIILKDELSSNNIDIKVIGDSDLELKVIPNQFKHVLINLISNSKDAFIENKIKNRLIIFEVENKNNKMLLKIKDNAGGIKKDIIPYIFESNFTTKEKEEGTGMGLYLAKQIIEKLNADIKVFNEQNGVCFEIIFDEDS